MHLTPPASGGGEGSALDQITFDFLTAPEFRQRFPTAHPPVSAMPTASRDGLLHLLESDHDGKFIVFLVRDDGPGCLWSRHFRAFFHGLPTPIVAAHVSANAAARQQVRERLQWHFIDVTVPEDDGPPDDRRTGAGPGAPVPRRPIPPTRPDRAANCPDDGA